MWRGENLVLQWQDPSQIKSLKAHEGTGQIHKKKAEAQYEINNYPLLTFFAIICVVVSAGAGPVCVFLLVVVAVTN